MAIDGAPAAWDEMCVRAGEAIRQSGQKWTPNLDWILKSAENYMKVANGGCNFSSGGSESSPSGSSARDSAKPGEGYWMEGKEYVSIDRDGKEWRSEVFKRNPLDHD